MSMTPEKRVKQRVTKMLDEIGAYYFYPGTHGFGRSGVPDIVGCINGKFFAIECKANGNTTTALQEREIKAINGAGGFAVIIDDKSNMLGLRNALLNL